MRFLLVVLLVSLVFPCVQVRAVSARMSTGFIENRGQVNEAVRHYFHGAGWSVYFTSEAVIVDLWEGPGTSGRVWEQSQALDAPSGAYRCVAPVSRRGHAIWIRFQGANPSPRLEARGELKTYLSYFLADDPHGWRSGVPIYSQIIYRDLWPGIDLVYSADRGDCCLRYQFVADRAQDFGHTDVGSDYSHIIRRIRYEGAERVIEAEEGSFLVGTSVGSLTDFRPTGNTATGKLVWGQGLGIAGHPWTSLGPGEWEGSGLLYSTYLGEGYADFSQAVAVDPLGRILVTGHTMSPEFPTTPGAYAETYQGGSHDVFVTKFDQEGSSLLWSTFLGGSEQEFSHSLVISPSGNVLVTGTTASFDFPTTAGAFDQSHNGGSDAFLVELDSTGSALLWSTFLGGEKDDCPLALTLTSTEAPIVTGWTKSAGFPTVPGAFDESFNGGCDAFVSGLDHPGSSLLWSTFLGGEGDDRGRAIALDPSGYPVVTGETESANFPVIPGAFDEYHGGGYDVFVSKFDSLGNALLWSTFLGGTSDEHGRGVGHDLFGDPLVTGYTGSTDFPTTPGCYDDSHNGFDDIFISQLDAEGAVLLRSTFVGGAGHDRAWALVLDASGNSVLAGHTESSDFPTTPGAYDTSHNGCDDIFVANLDHAGATLLHSTYLGGSRSDFGYDLNLDPTGGVVVTGHLFSSDFPTTPKAYDQTRNGCADVFVSRIGFGYPSQVPDVTTGVGLELTVAPNPTLGSTTIQYHSLSFAPATIDILDVTGRLVRSFTATSPHSCISWDGTDQSGHYVSSGIYFFRVATEGSRGCGRIILVR